MTEIPQELIAQNRRWKADPVYFVQSQFGVEPDSWQLEGLRAFPTERRICFRASKGPGKTCVLAWMIWNFMVTRPEAQVAVTSLSRDNLQDGLWKELAKWFYQSTFLQSMFTLGKTRIEDKHKPELCWVSARSWSRSADTQQQANSLSGLHSDSMMFVLDEVGDTPDSVLVAAEAGLATGTDTKIVMAGNPTNLEGPLYRACTTERHLWKLIEINGDPDNPKRSSRISLQWAKEQIEKYGRDNPWVLVNVFGKFPPGSLNTLLGPDQVQASMQRHLEETMYSHEAKILGVDPGRFGGARSVIFPRQGLAAFTPVVLRPNRSEKNWTGTFAARIAQASETFHADMIFVDDTGGWGAGIVDELRAGGHTVLGIPFGGSALDSRRYKNRRCEMHFEAAKWVQKGGALPFMPELQREACATKYWFRGGKFELEEKEQVKEVLGESPDLWDAFCITLAQPVVPRTGIDWIDRQTMHAKTDPDEAMWHRVPRALVEAD